MRRPNLTRMRKVNYDALYPVRWITGLPVDGEIPDPAGRMWTLPDRDVTRRPKSVTRWTMRRAEDA